MGLQAQDKMRPAASSYRRLCEGAQQCLKAAHLQGRPLAMLQDVLGSPEALAQHATKHDMDLMMELQRILFDKLEVGHSASKHAYPWLRGDKAHSHCLPFFTHP